VLSIQERAIEVADATVAFNDVGPARTAVIALAMLE
jgi:hypothetical protein